MKSVFILIQLGLSQILFSQNNDNLINSLKSLNKCKINYIKIKEKIIPVSFETLEKDTNFFMIPNTRIMYCKLNSENSSDFIKFNDEFYPLVIKKENVKIIVDMDILQADLTGFKFNGKEFISITSTGTGLNKSGTFQNIKINTILVMDNQKLTTNSFLNYVSDTLALGFFDNDTILEYLEFINNPVLENSGNINIFRFNSNYKSFEKYKNTFYNKNKRNKLKINKFKK